MDTNPTTTPNDPSRDADGVANTSATGETVSATHRLMAAGGLAVAGVLAAVGAFVFTGGDEGGQVEAVAVTDASVSTDAPATADAPTDSGATQPETPSPTAGSQPEEQQPAPAVPEAADDVAAAAEQAADDERAEPTEQTGQAADAEPTEDSGDQATETPVGEPAEASTDGPVKPTSAMVIGQDADGNDIMYEIEVTKICATTHHQELNGHPSYIRWVFDAPGIADDTQVGILFAPEGSGEAVEFVENSRIIVKQGIDRYGDYDFPSVEWAQPGDDNVTNTVTPDGSHTVNEKEGEPSKTCLE